MNAIFSFFTKRSLRFSFLPSFFLTSRLNNIWRESEKNIKIKGSCIDIWEVANRTIIIAICGIIKCEIGEDRSEDEGAWCR